MIWSRVSTSGGFAWIVPRRALGSPFACCSKSYDPRCEPRPRPRYLPRGGSELGSRSASGFETRANNLPVFELWGDARAVVRAERQCVFEDTGGVSHSSILHHDVSSGQGASCPSPAQTRPNSTRPTSTHAHQRRERSESFRAKFMGAGVQGRVPLEVIANAAR